MPSTKKFETLALKKDTNKLIIHPFLPLYRKLIIKYEQ